MPLNHTVKQEVIKNIERYEGRVNHLYLDTLDKVTVGIGHLVPNKTAISSITMYKSGLNGTSSIANILDKHAEYENIVKQPRGYPASWYKRHTTLVMKDSDVNALRDKHLESFYRELVGIYKKRNGYPDDFDQFPVKVQIALFDLIFNLGAYRITHSFPTLNSCIKAGDWGRAAQQSYRPQVSVERNQYVMQLFLSVPREEVVQ